MLTSSEETHFSTFQLFMLDIPENKKLTALEN